MCPRPYERVCVCHAPNLGAVPSYHVSLYPYATRVPRGRDFPRDLRVPGLAGGVRRAGWLRCAPVGRWDRMVGLG
eukprot:5649685-Prymnesium_polylepis.1